MIVNGITTIIELLHTVLYRGFVVS